MSFANKITFLYARVFSVIFFFASLFLVFFSTRYFLLNIEDNLKKTADDVELYIRSDKALDNKTVTNIAPNGEIAVLILRFDASSGDDAVRGPVPKNGYARLKGIYYNKDDFFKRKELSELIALKNRFLCVERNMIYKENMYNIIIIKNDLSEAKIRNNSLMILLLVNIIGVCIAAFIGRYMSSKLISPVVNIMTMAKRINIDDLSQRIVVPKSVNEFRELALIFNNMIANLEDSFKKQSRFVSDASHELRTPLAVINGYINLIDRWGKEDDKILQESIDSIKLETSYMSSLIKKLLFLSNNGDILKTKVALNSVAQEVVKEVRIIESGCKIELNEKSHEEIMADFNLIKQLLWIFIDNSIKYSQSCACIEIKIYGDEQISYMQVRDEGIGISSEELPNVIDRFYRVDKSRSKNIEGTGLGLSIANMIIQKHDADLNIASKLGEGTVITVSFKKLVL